MKIILIIAILTMPVMAQADEWTGIMWQTMTIGLEVFMVGNNLAMGIGIGF